MDSQRQTTIKYILTVISRITLYVSKFLLVGAVISGILLYAASTHSIYEMLSSIEGTTVLILLILFVAFIMWAVAVLSDPTLRKSDKAKID